MMAMVRYIHGTLTIRPQEMSFELHLRSLYPERNIMSVRQTETVSGQKGMDIQKKTDGAVNIIGEVATDEQAAWFVQAGQVASLFTIISHHAKMFNELVHSLRNSMVKFGMFSNESNAEQQVVRILHFDVHLNKDYEGRRYIERITECVPLFENEPYPDNLKDATREFFRRMTDRRTFEGRDIITFENGRYIAKNMITSSMQTQMMRYMKPEDRTAFEQMLAKHWKESA
jgi:pilus assembly protein CpaF